MPKIRDRRRSDVPGVFSYRRVGERQRLWGIEYKDVGGRTCRRVGYATKQKAVADRTAKAQRRAGVRPDPGAESIPFRDLVTRFLASYTAKTDYYKQRSRAWLAHFGDFDARGITAEDVWAFRRARQEKAGAATVRKDLVSLSTMFRWAVRAGILVSNPAAAELVKRPKKPAPRPNPLTDAEAEQLLEELPDWLRPVVTFALNTGADRGEVLALRWTNIDRDRRILYIPRAKTGARREIPYGNNQVLQQLLEDLHDDADDAQPLVFLRDEEPIGVEAAKTAMRRAWKAAGLQQKTRPWKSLRATFATEMIRQGVPLTVVAAAMGLTSTHVLEHYEVPAREQLEAAFTKAAPKRRKRTGGGSVVPFRKPEG